MRKFLCLISVLLVSVLCGCNGYREIDRGYLVTAIGLYEKDNIAEIYIEALSSLDASNKELQRVVLKAEGKDIISAYENLKATLVKPLYFELMGTVIFEGEGYKNLNFLKEIPNINYGIYVVKTDDVAALFENDRPKGILGYDIISLIKTTHAESNTQITNQFYQIADDINLPIVNFLNGNLVRG